jgi:hypothetical protein
VALTRTPEEDLAEVRDKIAAMRVEREDTVKQIDCAIAEMMEREAKIAAFIEMRAVYLRSDAAPLAVPQPQAPQHLPIPSPSKRAQGVRRPYGMMLAAIQMCIEILKETGRPWLTRDLVPELSRRGLPLDGENAVLNLSNRLGKSNAVRSHKVLGWHLAEWPDFPDPAAERIAILRAKVLEAAPNAADCKMVTLSEATKRRFFGMSIADAATSVLEERGKPVGNVEIASMLEEAGFPFGQKDHAVAVDSNLRRRMRQPGEVARADQVVRVASGTWGLARWYTDEEISEFAAAIGGMPGRDFTVHQQKTLAGVKAARARGIRVGSKPKFSAEQIEIAKKMDAEGQSTKAIASAFGVSSAAVLKWKNKWKRGMAKMQMIDEEPT